MEHISQFPNSLDLFRDIPDNPASDDIMYIVQRSGAGATYEQQDRKVGLRQLSAWFRRGLNLQGDAHLDMENNTWINVQNGTKLSLTGGTITLQSYGGGGYGYSSDWLTLSAPGLEHSIQCLHGTGTVRSYLRMATKGSLDSPRTGPLLLLQDTAAIQMEGSSSIVSSENGVILKDYAGQNRVNAQLVHASGAISTSVDANAIRYYAASGTSQRFVLNPFATGTSDAILWSANGSSNDFRFQANGNLSLTGNITAGTESNTITVGSYARSGQVQIGIISANERIIYKGPGIASDTPLFRVSNTGEVYGPDIMPDNLYNSTNGAANRRRLVSEQTVNKFFKSVAVPANTSWSDNTLEVSRFNRRAVLSGYVYRTGGSASPTGVNTIATLPVEFRPASQISGACTFMTSNGVSLQIANFTISTAGVISVDVTQAIQATSPPGRIFMAFSWDIPIPAGTSLS